MIRLFLLGIYYTFSIYWYIMIAGVILTWLPGLNEYKIPRMIRGVSEWYLGPFQGKVVFGMLDFTPIIGFVLYSGVLSLLNDVVFF